VQAGTSPVNTEDSMSPLSAPILQIEMRKLTAANRSALWLDGLVQEIGDELVGCRLLLDIR